jgi:transposase-like protein
VREGVSISDAARGNDVSPDTVKGWLKKGRNDPDGPYSEFADLVDDALDFVRGMLGDEETEPGDVIPSRAELIRRLDAASKKGSVRATQLLLEARAREDAEGGTEDDDPLAALDAPPDELAPRRNRS